MLPKRRALPPLWRPEQLPGGQSSHSTSPNYDDLLPLYLDNQPSPIIFDVAEAANVAAETIEYRQ